jgi:hypothetical protein
MMEALGITLKDLGDVKSCGPKVGANGKVQMAAGWQHKKKKTTSAVPVKYRGPTGET